MRNNFNSFNSEESIGDIGIRLRSDDPAELRYFTEQFSTIGSIMRKLLKLHRHLQRKKNLNVVNAVGANYCVNTTM